MNPLPATNKYVGTTWRQTPQYIGGYILDGGVHFVAALRLVSGARVISVASAVGHAAEHLPPPTLLTATLVGDNGALMSLSMSHCCAVRHVVLRASCPRGDVVVTRGERDGKFGYTVDAIVPGASGSSEFYPFDGVDNELVAFANAVRGVAEDSNSGDEALVDVKIVEKMVTFPGEKMSAI
jgi:predicted dehydrogenase